MKINYTFNKSSESRYCTITSVQLNTSTVYKFPVTEHQLKELNPNIKDYKDHTTDGLHFDFSTSESTIKGKLEEGELVIWLENTDLEEKEFYNKLDLKDWLNLVKDPIEFIGKSSLDDVLLKEWIGNWEYEDDPIYFRFEEDPDQENLVKEALKDPKIQYFISRNYGHDLKPTHIDQVYGKTRLYYIDYWDYLKPRSPEIPIYVTSESTMHMKQVDHNLFLKKSTYVDNENSFHQIDLVCGKVVPRKTNICIGSPTLPASWLFTIK